MRAARAIVSRAVRIAATATIVVLTIAVAVSWVRSSTVYDHFGWQRYRLIGTKLRHQIISIGCVRGRIVMHVAATDLEADESASARLSQRDLLTAQEAPTIFRHRYSGRRYPGSLMTDWELPVGSVPNAMGFALARGVDRRPLFGQSLAVSSFRPIWYLKRDSRFCTVIVPHWFVLLPLLFLSYRLIVRVNRRLVQARRTRRGLCRHCGYDLRATPDRCPECGAACSKSEKLPPHPTSLASVAALD